VAAREGASQGMLFGAICGWMLLSAAAAQNDNFNDEWYSDDSVNQEVDGDSRTDAANNPRMLVAVIAGGLAVIAFVAVAVYIHTSPRGSETLAPLLNVTIGPSQPIRNRPRWVARSRRTAASWLGKSFYHKNSGSTFSSSEQSSIMLQAAGADDSTDLAHSTRTLVEPSLCSQAGGLAKGRRPSNIWDTILEGDQSVDQSGHPTAPPTPAPRPASTIQTQRHPPQPRPRHSAPSLDCSVAHAIPEAAVSEVSEEGILEWRRTPLPAPPKPGAVVSYDV